MKKRGLVVDVACFLFVLLFVYAAASKMLELDKFETQLGRSPVITRFSSILLWLVPGLEILLALLMFWSKTKLFALYGSFSLMVAFTAYIIVILNFSENIPCSCGGILQDMTWRQHLVFNVIFVLMAVVAVLIYPSNNKNIVAQQ
ncbi:MauE/DoxX family redox-associated membrane protein [Pedobacter heparinus]|uniref:Methylamine utilisation protein MauE domain-containing protein n=1 Tax=Pedobacter heparinus (strain ATCC 13125 / DSM 2366 / CIP 104194 / JCM 7457 / NBRC 12017 / NCIMB 9290 / NRRL B-14731 / HIM 762-3) TaxID=485917 RepID=C6XVE9_PEDHD|nr:MauE/DoxX family redox-associated membrane protein [Pedobacter heparinus]ACU04015.1 hypothetical protein Phep_1806 [Pedobacter heparinus DSM 2366]